MAHYVQNQDAQDEGLHEKDALWVRFIALVLMVPDCAFKIMKVCPDSGLAILLLQATAEQRKQALEARIHELENTVKTVGVTAPAPAVSQPTNEAATTPPQTVPSSLNALPPAVSMEVNIGSPPRMVSFSAQL